MTASLTKAPTELLVEQFAEIAIEQDKALLYDEVAKFNRLYSKLDDIDKELRARGTQARLALASLFNHPNPQVRVTAASRTLGVAPAAAREVLEALRDSKEQPQALDAHMLLWGIDRGEFKPT